MSSSITSGSTPYRPPFFRQKSRTAPAPSPSSSHDHSLKLLSGGKSRPSFLSSSSSSTSFLPIKSSIKPITPPSSQTITVSMLEDLGLLLRDLTIFRDRHASRHHALVGRRIQAAEAGAPLLAVRIGQAVAHHDMVLGKSARAGETGVIVVKRIRAHLHANRPCPPALMLEAENLFLSTRRLMRDYHA